LHVKPPAGPPACLFVHPFACMCIRLPACLVSCVLLTGVCACMRFVSLATCLCIRLVARHDLTCIFLSIYPCTSIYLSAQYVSIHPSICIACQSFPLSDWCPRMCLVSSHPCGTVLWYTIFLPIYLSIYLSIYMYVCMYVCIYVCMYVSLSSKVPVSPRWQTRYGKEFIGLGCNLGP
jgi:hypothetical protein